jgi:hypothetical protein
MLLHIIIKFLVASTFAFVSSLLIQPSPCDTVQLSPCDTLTTWFSIYHVDKSGSSSRIPRSTFAFRKRGLRAARHCIWLQQLASCPWSGRPLILYTLLLAVNKHACAVGTAALVNNHMVYMVCILRLIYIVYIVYIHLPPHILYILDISRLYLEHT